MSQYYNRPIAFRVANVFSNHMVLQREKNIHVFGEAQPDTQVLVTLIRPDGSQTVAQTMAEDNKWLAILPPQKSAEGCILRVDAYRVIREQAGVSSTEDSPMAEDCRKEEDGHKAEEKRLLMQQEYTDVSIGEVWLAGGQSNMELELKDCAGGMESLQNDKNSNVRFYYTPKEPYKNKHFYEVEEGTSWQTFDEENAKIVAKSVICSSLFKAAMFGADANWGRVLCAIGYSGADVDISKVGVSFESEKGKIEVCRNGAGVEFSEDKAKEILLCSEIRILISAGEGSGHAVAWGCDLTYDYVKINGDYRT